LIRHQDFQDAASLLFGEKFGAITKERLEAPEVLKKTMSSDYSKQGEKPPSENKLRGWQPIQQQWGWQGPGNKARKGLPKK